MTLTSPLPFYRKVLGVGLGRTGTVSLTRALNQLEVSTVHYVSLDTDLDPERTEAVCRKVLARHQGIANGTGLPFERLDRAYPGSRFILTVRDEEDWLASKRSYAERELNKWAQYSPERRKVKRAIRERVYGSFEFDPERWLDAYHSHCSWVRSYFKDRPGHLLVLDIPSGAGWEPLCSFLGATVPEEPFPRANTRKVLDEWAARVRSFWADVDEIVEPDEPVLLVDDGRLPTEGRPVRRFGERNGQYQGQPEDEAMVVAELDQLRSAGIHRVIFAWDAFWWLEEYSSVRARLEEGATVEVQSPDLLCYRLIGGDPE
jgi:hypothetical protein